MRAFLQLFHRIEKTVSALGLAILSILVVIDVVGREVVGQGWLPAQRSSVYLMIWVGFLGATLASAKNAHLAPEVADRLWKKDWVPYLTQVQQLSTALFCAFMGYLALGYVAETFSMGEKDVVTGIQLGWVQGILPYTFLSLALRHLFYFIQPSLIPEKPQ